MTPTTAAVAAVAAASACLVAWALRSGLHRRRRRRLTPYERRLHALDGFVRRLACTPHTSQLVLRGSYLLRAYLPALPRPVADLDFLALCPNDAPLVESMIRDACDQRVADGLAFARGAVSSQRHWEGTEHPGLKLTVECHELNVGSDASRAPATHRFSVDVGWGDPLVPPPGALHVRAAPVAAGGASACVPLAARAETLLAWKLHGLFEHESAGLSQAGVPKGYWRPKDLFDCCLLATAGARLMRASALRDAVVAAFASRGYPVSRLVRLAHGRFGTSTKSARNYARWRASVLASAPAAAESGRRGAAAPIPESAQACVAALAPTCAAVLRELGYAPLPGETLPFAPAWQVAELERTLASAPSRVVVDRAAPITPSTAPRAAAREPSATTATAPEALFIVGGANRAKWEETAKVLAEYASLVVPCAYTPPEELRFPPGLADGSTRAVDVVHALARHCHKALGRACIVELALLELAGGARPLVLHRLPAHEERGFARAHAGRAARFHALIGYIGPDGGPVEVLEGDLDGEIVSPVRGERAHGWNRCFQPEGHGKTLGELGESLAYVQPRVRPLLELAAMLRTPLAYGTLERSRGLFELHVSVRTPSEPEGGVPTFREACGLLGVKAVVIDNEGGATPRQLMTASYTQGSLRDALTAAFVLARRLSALGFCVLRTKVEAGFHNPGVPATDAEAAALSPHNYFEVHWKLRLPRGGAELPALARLAAAHGARLSRSALKRASSGGEGGVGHEQRFVTLRLYDCGRERAAERVRRLTDELAEHGYHVLTTIREYAVYDSNVAMDAGWIDAPGPTARPGGRASGAAPQTPAGAARDAAGKLGADALATAHEPFGAVTVHSGRASAEARGRVPPRGSQLDASAGRADGATATAAVARTAAPPRGAAGGPAAEASATAATEALGDLVRGALWHRAHPARGWDPSQLLGALLAEVGAGRASVAWEPERGGAAALTGADGGAGRGGARLGLFHYKQSVKHWTPALLLARGLLLRQDGRHATLVGTPFPKFFELGRDGVSLAELEHCALRWEATEKLDGSMALLVCDRGRWRVLTKRGFGSEQAAWAESWLRARAAHLPSALEAGCTYVCEVVSRANWVVVRYPPEREGVWLCAAYGRDGAELERPALEAVAARAGLPLVPLVASGVLRPAPAGGATGPEAGDEPARARLRETIGAALDAPDGHRAEGLVLRFVLPGGAAHRAKVKARAYARLYRLQDGLTPRAAWTAAKAGGVDALDALCDSAPEEFAHYMAGVRTLTLAAVCDTAAQAHMAVRAAAAMGRTDARGLAELLREASAWPDGAPITQAQRRLAHKALAGRLGAAELALGAVQDGGPDRARAARGAALLGQLDATARHALFTFVPVSAPQDARSRHVHLADGTRLLNHQRH